MIKQYVELLKQKMPKNLSELEISRYIYIDLATKKLFNEEFLFGEEQRRKMIYQEEECKDAEELIKKDQLTCVGLSKCYKEILKEFNISSLIVSDDDSELRHVYNIINLEDQRVIKADIQQDMKYIKVGMKTKNFGVDSFESYDEINAKDLKIIDKKIGYIIDEYKDGEIEKEIIDSASGVQKNDNGFFISFEKFLNNSLIKKINSNLGYVENFMIYKKVVKEWSNYCNKKNSVISVFNCFKNKNKKRQNALFIWARDELGRQKIYVFDEKNNRFATISKNTMTLLMKQGLKINCKYSSEALEFKNEMEINVKKSAQNHFFVKS